MGCSGRNDVMTPTLDTLAAGGVRYDSIYSECPVCIPARRTLMTGLSPRHHGDRVYNDTLPMPDVPTLAQIFRDNGYQAYAVGKLHVYPQRNRIGFDDVLLQEEGRYEFGVTDDYQIWLGEQGYAGQEYMHGMGNNTYYTRPWHLPEAMHPTNWATTQMMRMIKRRDPTRPAFFYLSYIFPHPPLVPLQSFLDMYKEDDIPEPICGNWIDNSYIMRAMTEMCRGYSHKEMRRAKHAFYAQCTHIDYQIRLLIGSLRESNILDNTIIVFLSDHGDMLFDHGMVAKRCFYDNAARIPLIISGKPMLSMRGTVDSRLGCLADIMPTLLDICGMTQPKNIDGISLQGTTRRAFIYGEVSDGPKATRMIRSQRYKLIYYPYGNIVQLFDMEKDPLELDNIASKPDISTVQTELEQELIKNLYGVDLQWISDGRLVGQPAPEFTPKEDYGLYNQRGLHWPAPAGYSNIGKNA